MFGQSTLGSQEMMSNGSSQPRWTSNHKKRIIPNHLVPTKKTGFHLSTSTGSKNKKNDGNGNLDKSSSLVSTDQYNILSFGSQRRKTIGQQIPFDKSALFDTTSVDLTRMDDTGNDSIYEDNIVSMGEDMPPTRSIHDLNDEILVGLNKPTQSDSFINKDPQQFRSIFNRDQDPSLTNLNANSDKMNSLTTNESAVLVFGYPESISELVIQHFQDFGTILENFDSKTSTNSLLSIDKDRQHKIIPIFSGKNWVKITFDNPESAIEALQENGIVFNGCILGVIPYSKDAIEKLQKRKLSKVEDIGGKIDLSSISTLDDNNLKTNNNNNTNINKVVNTKGNNNNKANNSINNTNSVTTKLDIKDGSKFFLKSEEELKSINNTKSSNNNLTLIQKATKFLFGFHEL